MSKENELPSDEELADERITDHDLHVRYPHVSEGIIGMAREALRATRRFINQIFQPEGRRRG